MPASTETTIHTNKRYRALRDFNIQIYDYEEMNIQIERMPAGQIFQPWATFESWHGDKIAISLDDDDRVFDWGIRTGIVFFVKWEDLLSNCEIAAANGLLHTLKKGFKSIPLNQIRQSRSALSNDENLTSSKSRLLPSQELFDRDDHGRTRLFYAAERGHLAQVKRMCLRMPGTGMSPQRLGFIEKKDLEGKTAAEIAEENGHQDIADFLRGEAMRMEYFG